MNDFDAGNNSTSIGVELEQDVEELYEMAPCGYLTVGIDGRIVKVNRTLTEWLGYGDGNAGELISGKHLIDLLTGDSRKLFETRVTPELEARERVDAIDVDLVCRDTRVLPTIISARQKRNSAGRPVLNRFTILDATERRTYERLLPTAPDLFKTTLSSIGDGVVATDVEGRITLMNPVAQGLSGWTEREALGKSIDEVLRLVREDSGECIENPVTHALRAGVVVGLANHTVLIGKHARSFTVDDSASPIRDPRGTVIGGVLIFRDVTERRHTERALELSENQFRTTFAKAPLGLVLTHFDGRFIECNDAYRELTGYTREELPAISFLSLTHPEEADNNRKLFEQLLKEKIDSYVIEKRIFNKGGELLWVRAHAKLLRNADGKAARVIGLVEDITASKSAEIRFRFLAESIPQMVWTATPDGMLDYVNRQGCDYLGAPQDALLAAGWLDRVHTDDQAEAVRRWTASVQTGTNYEAQFRLRRGSDASWRLHLVRALPFKGESGEVKQWFGTCTDIEEQSRAALQIEADRERWRELLLRTPAGIAILRGREHRVEWMNAEFERLIGRLTDQLTGRTFAEVLPELDEQGYTGMLDRIFETGEPFVSHEVQVRVRRTGGQLEPLYWNCVCLPTKDALGAIDGVYAHVSDVTAMVTVRQRIEESEARFRTLAESIPQLTWMADNTGHIFWYNQRWYDYTGTTIEQMEGWGWQKVHDPEILPEVLKNWRAAIESGEPFEMIFPLRSTAGEMRPFLTRVLPLKDPDGTVVRWFGTNTDITDQRKIEERLRRLNRELEEFSYIASHDLQEPLRAVNVYTQLMVLKKDGADLERYAGLVKDAVKRMHSLIQDLLAYSRTIESEEVTPGKAALEDAYGEALELLKGRIEETGAAITAGPLPVTRGNQEQLAHVFQNVLSNALKYQAAGTLPRVHVEARIDAGLWVISIRDNGIGFEQQYADRIFGLFTRLHKNEYPGTGLGLAICRKIVERSGGRMWAESEEGKGATFYFALPPG